MRSGVPRGRDDLLEIDIDRRLRVLAVLRSLPAQTPAARVAAHPKCLMRLMKPSPIVRAQRGLRMTWNDPLRRANMLVWIDARGGRRAPPLASLELPWGSMVPNEYGECKRRLCGLEGTSGSRCHFRFFRRNRSVRVIGVVLSRVPTGTLVFECFPGGCIPDERLALQFDQLPDSGILAMG